MKRREFIALLGGMTAAWPLAARAQQPGGIRRIGVLMGRFRERPEDRPSSPPSGRDSRSSGGRRAATSRSTCAGRHRRRAIDCSNPRSSLLRCSPISFFRTARRPLRLLLQQTRTIPIVFAIVSDPVGSGFVASFPRPGGNVTGFTDIEPTMAGKSLELLKEIAPRVDRVAFLFNPETAPYAEYYLIRSKPPLRPSQWRRSPHLFTTSSELETAIAALAGEPNGGLVAMTDSFLVNHRASDRHRWPLATVSRRSIRIACSLKSAACCPTETTRLTIFGARRPMPIASSRARSRASFRSRPRSSSSW